MRTGKLIAYTDGSYNNKTKEAGIGVIVYDEKRKAHIELQDTVSDESYNSRNITGECLAVCFAIHYAWLHDYAEIDIYHDYSGLSKWASGEWRVNSRIAEEYVHTIEDYTAAGLKISFHKVKAHTGDAFNETADRLAKEAAGIL